MKNQTMHTMLARLSLLPALIGLLLISPHLKVAAQEARLNTFIRVFEGVGGYEITTTGTNYGPECWESRTNISVNWSPTGAGHNERKFYYDPIYGGAGPQARPKGSTEFFNYSRDDWPALPDVGTNYFYYGLTSQFSSSMVTNSEPVDCRGGAEFRYA